MTTEQHEPQMTEVQRWSDVPTFASEREEADYWDTHALGDEILATMVDAPDDPGLPPPRERTHRRAQMISIRLDMGDLERLKAAAQRRGVGYQPLLKQWLRERLAAEEAIQNSTGSIGGTPTPASTSDNALAELEAQ